MMKNIIQKMRAALDLILVAPLQLSNRIIQIVKYVALGLGVVETILKDQEGKEDEVE